MSHEAIYQWVYAQPVATLRRELIALRTGRTRRSGPRPAPAPRIREPRYLDERPAEVEGRPVPGHWEGDIIGYLAWTWNPWGCSTGAVLIKDWNGTPEPGVGEGLKAHLLSVTHRRRKGRTADSQV